MVPIRFWSQKGRSYGWRDTGRVYWCFPKCVAFEKVVQSLQGPHFLICKMGLTRLPFRHMSGLNMATHRRLLVPWRACRPWPAHGGSHGSCSGQLTAPALDRDLGDLHSSPDSLTDSLWVLHQHSPSSLNASFYKIGSENWTLSKGRRIQFVHWSICSIIMF